MQRDLQRPSLGSGETPGVAARVIERPTHLARETTPLAWRAEVSQSCERLAVAARFGALAALTAAAAHWRPWHMCTRFESLGTRRGPALRMNASQVIHVTELDALRIRVYSYCLTGAGRGTCCHVVERLECSEIFNALPLEAVKLRE